MKFCSRCKKNKSLSSFSKDRSRKDGLLYLCKSCIAINSKKYYTANRGKAMLSSRSYYSKNRDKTKAYYKAFNKRYYATNREKLKATGKKYRIMNSDKIRNRKAVRRARELNSYIAFVDRQKIFKRDGGRCHICKSKVDPENWHLDHIIPISKSGTHEPKNVSVSHPRCNQQKGATGVAQLRLMN